MADDKSEPKRILKIDHELKVDMYLQHSSDFTTAHLMIKFSEAADWTEVLAALAVLIEESTTNETDHFTGGRLTDLQVH